MKNDDEVLAAIDTFCSIYRELTQRNIEHELLDRLFDAIEVIGSDANGKGYPMRSPIKDEAIAIYNAGSMNWRELCDDLGEDYPNFKARLQRYAQRHGITLRDGLMGRPPKDLK